MKVQFTNGVVTCAEFDTTFARNYEALFRCMMRWVLKTSPPEEEFLIQDYSTRGHQCAGFRNPVVLRSQGSYPWIHQEYRALNVFHIASEIFSILGGYPSAPCQGFFC
jgi:hypothetical protein